MPKIIIDGREVECREGIPVLQAALEAGVRVPHYCYHPGLSVVASCRLCLMEMKMPHPQTKELGWAPKLFPSCQTPVKDGMEVRFNSDKVAGNTKHVMEYYLLNHPLDCPVCDKAGECYLQDYTEEFASASSRMVEDKWKNPKKDIGPRTLLYQDRCVLCSRCVRFADEVAGTSELVVVNRGSRGEIDVFPGEPLANPVQGNVVDLCPVGALLDKGFLFKQRVWLLKQTKSVTAEDSSGATIIIEHNNNELQRIRPRFNEKVNEWWISDEQRFGWRDYVHHPDRLNQPVQREGENLVPLRWEDIPAVLRDGLTANGSGREVAAVLSPLMSCEEAWLLATFVRDVAPEALLAVGHVPIEGRDIELPKCFTLPAEKCPNRRGIEVVLEHFGGNTGTLADVLAGADSGSIKAACVVGGYKRAWVSAEMRSALGKLDFLAVHDLFASSLDEIVTVRIPCTTFAEREGSYLNRDGLLQAFDRAIAPLDGVKFDGQFYYELAGQTGIYRAAKVRQQLAADLPVFAEPFEPRPEPDYSH